MSQPQFKKVIVIGAGPAGLTAAYQLSKQGYQVAVYEASSHIGGLARTIELWGHKVDLGPHRFFSSDKRVNSMWLEVVGKDYQMVNRLTRIYYNRVFFAYPLKLFDAFFKMGPLRAFQCFFSYLKAQVNKSPNPTTFEDWVVGRFGRQLFNQFFKTYSEKLWGISCQELDSDFAAQRIKKFSLGEAIKTALGLGGAGHKTLVDRFAYPNEGTGVVYERMAQYVEENGGTIHLQCPVKKVCSVDGRVTGVELDSGAIVPADFVVSTMPFTLMVKTLIENRSVELQSALDALTYRNTILVYLRVEQDDLFPDQWLYVHSDDIGFGRICNFRNWVPELYAKGEGTVLSLEYWCYDTDSLWQESQESIIERAISDLVKTGLVEATQIREGHVIHIPRSYPVYKTGYKNHLQTIVNAISGFENLYPIGRYGAFKYNNQDHSILMGLLAAEKIAKGDSSIDLWSVNTDYDDYQETATIDESGLSTS